MFYLKKKKKKRIYGKKLFKLFVNMEYFGTYQKLVV